jgi:hypothetical protein
VKFTRGLLRCSRGRSFGDLGAFLGMGLGADDASGKDGGVVESTVLLRRQSSDAQLCELVVAFLKAHERSL